MENPTIWIIAVVGGIILSTISAILPKRFRYIPQLITFIGGIGFGIASRVYGG
jgi:hypothetical protein